MVTRDEVFNVSTRDFEALALRIFAYQYTHVSLYRAFCNAMKKQPGAVTRMEEIPFLPIQFFRTHRVAVEHAADAVVFESSGTTGSVPSRHHIVDVSWYDQSLERTFRMFYGDPGQYVWLALMPSPAERPRASLLYMVERFMQHSGDALNGYYLHNFSQLHQALIHARETKRKTILIGITYALLDFAQAYKIHFPDLIVMETGGMKGKRPEMTREEVHQLLCETFGVQAVHSEYGMTELSSQAYSQGKGLFVSPPWMKILLRHTDDPTHVVRRGRNGALNIIDLANVNSCAFIATEDVGTLNDNGSFFVHGRMLHAEQRGCNLMMAE
ncbi:MAG: acyl transferase [Chitinophagales bacterium]|nr:acyl transferase [Chitinophagales bacterium]MDW8419931.1 acyl transferase [Chitinophagales bacterium]